MRGGVVRTLLIASLAVSGACGSDDDAATDAAAMADGEVERLAAPPDIPWLAAGAPPVALPELTPCPDGWREVSSDGVTTCEPYPEGGPASCADGEAHFPGEPGCVRVGPPCPAGDFADGLPTDRRVVYVQPGATGGDGSLARPYGAVTEFSIAALPARTVIALSRGRHEGPIRLVRGHTLWGACTAATVVYTSIEHPIDGVVMIVTAEGEVRALTVADSPRLGVKVDGAGAIGTLDGVVIVSTRYTGLGVLDEARLVAETLAVSDIQPEASGFFGTGAQIALNGQAEIRRATFRDNRDIGVGANGPGVTLELSDVAILQTRAAMDGSGGLGVVLQDDAAATVSRSIFEGNRSAGFSVEDPGAALSDVVVRDTGSRPLDSTDGRGLVVRVGGVVELRRALLEGNRTAGISVQHAGSALTASDVVVRDTESQESDGRDGIGLVVLSATAEVSRAIVSRNRGVALLANAAMAPTALTLSDLIASDTRAQTVDGQGGRGLNLQEGATARVSRARFERNGEFGLYTTHAGTALVAEDVLVSDTRSRDVDGLFGRALETNRDARAELTRAVFERNGEVSINASGAVHMVLTDLVVRDTQSSPRTGLNGQAMNIQLGATVEVSRALLERNRELGIAAFAGSNVTLSDLQVIDTLPRDCASTTCASAPVGHGIGSYHAGTRVRIERFAVRGGLCGLHLAASAELDLDDGEVSGNTIGACVQVEGYDIARLRRDVRYRDNGVNLDITDLPLPEPTADAESAP